MNPDSRHGVEEIIARVNNEIITRSEYDKAAQLPRKKTPGRTAKAGARRSSCRPTSDERKKTALRDLMDQSLLAQRGKDMGRQRRTGVDETAGSDTAHRTKSPAWKSLEKAVTPRE